MMVARWVFLLHSCFFLILSIMFIGHHHYLSVASAIPSTLEKAEMCSIYLINEKKPPEQQKDQVESQDTLDPWKLETTLKYSTDHCNILLLESHCLFVAFCLFELLSVSAQSFCSFKKTYLRDPETRKVVAEAKQRREEKRRLIREQQRQVSKVLLDGLYDPDSPISKLLGVRTEIMGEIIWQQLVENWQIYPEHLHPPVHMPVGLPIDLPARNNNC